MTRSTLIFHDLDIVFHYCIYLRLSDDQLLQVVTAVTVVKLLQLTSYYYGDQIKVNLKII